MKISLIVLLFFCHTKSYFNYTKLLGLKQTQQVAQSGPMYAVCVLRQNNNSGVSGVVAMKQINQYSRIQVMANVKGLQANGIHGFHIHENGDMTNGCTSMGGHYNPDNHDHAGPNDVKRHVGDLGNLRANDKGEVDALFEDPQVNLFGSRSVLGRGCVVHLKEDDLGRGGDQESKKTGNAGARIACGVVALAKSYAEIDRLTQSG